MDAKTQTLLIQSAKKAAEKAYCPYSGYAVGAAVLAGSGKIYDGCNIENASYSLTMCAERTALFKAVSAGEREILAVCVYSDGEKLPYPCGACRQALSEFCKDAEVIVTDGEEIRKISLSELLPDCFR